MQTAFEIHNFFRCQSSKGPQKSLNSVFFKVCSKCFLPSRCSVRKGSVAKHDRAFKVQGRILKTQRRHRVKKLFNFDRSSVDQTDQPQDVCTGSLLTSGLLVLTHHFLTMLQCVLWLCPLEIMKILWGHPATRRSVPTAGSR